MNNKAKIRNVVLAAGIAVVLFELLFPPLRSPSPIYSELQHIDGSYRQQAVQVSRFPNWGQDMSKLDNDRGVVRTEVDAGELLRELAFLAVLFGAGYLWLPAFLNQTNDWNERALSEYAQKKYDSKDDAGQNEN
jgi:hypothetical protein